LALLFMADVFFPKLPAVEDTSTVAGSAVSDLSVIRIHSDRKWPERVEFDTSHPVITPAPVRMAEAGSSANDCRSGRASAPARSICTVADGEKAGTEAAS
jgi:hypothetical protein